MKRILLSVVVAALIAPIYASAQGRFYLHNGDRVVFYGDSITDQRLYTLFTEAYVVTRFPRMNVTFVHSGWGGDRVTGGGGGPVDTRLKRDVIAYDPTVMTIMLGMNDGGYRPFDQGLFDTYSNGYQHIIDTIKGADPSCRITVVDPSPFDDVTREPNFPGGYNAVLIRYGEFVKGLAQKDNLTFADMNTPLVAALQHAKELDASVAPKIVPDRVHPGPGGHLLMAEALLKAWDAPAIVSAVEIDAAGRRVARSNNTRVSGVSGEGSNLAWTQDDESLPMPIDTNDPATALAVRASDVLRALDQETVKVTGLAGGRYLLKIDGQEAGEFSRDELANGVNLALHPTPMLKQSLDVLNLVRLHDNLHFTRWRELQVPHADDLERYRGAMAALDRADADVARQARAAAAPTPHHYELIAQ